ncbi:hypothetical protein SCUCBS95973_002283 [Sporothrix curviconia]|uniref:Xylanolytic transcriptional activator regulatory domain-containing protein n=1 Tax=Sporothrix curviconia TaxID=1260050 RepID=A0ABP0B6D2_9PEZI
MEHQPVLSSVSPVSPAHRRSRVAVACDLCRKRKIKRHLTCVYQEPQQRVQVTQAYLTKLLCRVDDLQRSRATPGSGLAEDDGQDVEMDDGGVGDVVGDVVGSTDSPVSSPPSSVPSIPSVPATTTATTDCPVDCPVDAMVCVGPSPETSTASASYYGQSSTLSFLRSLQSTVFRGDVGAESNNININNNSSTPAGVYPAQPSSRNTHASTVPPPLPLKYQFLPPRATADHLVNVYFSHVSDLYTVLHEPSFRRAYEQLWLPEDPASSSHSTLHHDALWLCTMNCVLALACVFSDRLRPEDSKSMAHTLYSQARDLCPLDDDVDRQPGKGSTAGVAGVARVQALLLMGQYLQSTSEVNRCWNVFGMAIRVAQGMGLHLHENNNSSRVPPLERELRRRCWCGCLVMDTVLAMTFGRPLMISAEHYYDYEGTEADTCNSPSPAPQQPGLLLFTHKLKLYLVLQRVLRTFYQTKDSGSCGSMAELDQQLHAWQAQLPASLRMDIDHASPGPSPETETPSTTASIRSSSERPRHILYARYLAVRIMLTRPSLAMVARASGPTNATPRLLLLAPLEQSFARSAAETCIATAKHLLEHIHTHLVVAERPAPLGASWYNTHSVFSATLVLFAAQTIAALRPLVVEGRHWADGIEVMRLLAERFTPAHTCLSIMETFHRHLNGGSGTDNTASNMATTQAADSAPLPDEAAASFFPHVPGYFTPVPSGDWFDFASFSGFDDVFAQDIRW